MMRETKVNLKHLLEDIRDNYTIPLEEIIVVELVANCLDSGASRISFFIDPEQKCLTVVDNGKGMRRETLADYHNIAATAKVRGQGIGFAGVGAKLSLLVAEEVNTESKGGYGSRCATQWRLKSDISAPWKFAPFSGKVPYSRGTAVSIRLPEAKSRLLQDDFVVKTIQRYYYPLFVTHFLQFILKHIYKKGVEFFINNKSISFSPNLSSSVSFEIKLGGSKRLVGVGFLAKSDLGANDLPFYGLAVSCFGKVIKSGWEWLGFGDKSQSAIWGMVEIPALSEILTINKMDFLKDGASLKKYYLFRKAIQEAVLPILRQLGEQVESANIQKNVKRLTGEIEKTLQGVLVDFPELAPLLGIKKVKKSIKGFSSTANPSVSFLEQASQDTKTPDADETTFAKNEKTKSQKPGNGLRAVGDKKGKKGPALSIGFEQLTESEPLARMIENRILINVAHPAYSKAKANGLEQYHIIWCVAWVLSGFLEDNKSPQDFLNAFLAFWGKELSGPKQLQIARLK